MCTFCFTTFLILFNLTIYSKQYDINTFMKSSNCFEDKLIPVLRSYFSSQQCVTLLYLGENILVEDELLRFDTLPQVVRHVQTREFSSAAPVSTRPRRDLLTKDGNIQDFCRGHPEGFLIFSPDMHTLNNYTFADMVTPFLNPQALFFIYLGENIESTNVTCLESWMSRVWQVYSTPHVHASCCGCAQLHAWQPRERAAPRPGWGVMRSLGLEESVPPPDLALRDLRGMPFPIVMFSALTAQPVRHNRTIVRYNGIDGNLASLLEAYMNFTTVLLQPEDGETYGRRRANNSLSGGLGTLSQGRAQLACVSHFAMDYGTRDTELTAAPLGDELSVVVRRARAVPTWLAPARYLGAPVGAALLAAWLLVAAAWAGLQRAAPLAQRPAASVPLDTLRLALAFPVERAPRTVAERIFLASAAVAFLTLATVFQGALVAVHSTTLFYPDINTLRQLADAGLPILTRFEWFKDAIFSDESSPTSLRLRALVRVYRGQQEINRVVGGSGAVAGLTRHSATSLDNSTALCGADGNALLHMVAEHARSYTLAYVVPRASAFAPRINQLILRVSQAGLFEKWFRDMAANNTQGTCRGDGGSGGGGGAGGGTRPLALADLQLASGLLAAGTALGTVAFLWELLRSWCTKSKARRRAKARSKAQATGFADADDSKGRNSNWKFQQ